MICRYVEQLFIILAGVVSNSCFAYPYYIKG